MSNVKIENYSVIYDDYNNNRHVLLDGEHLMRNVSSIPLQIFEDSDTVLSVLTDIQEMYEYKARGTDWHNLNAFLINCIIANYMVEQYKPVKCAQLGCENGIVSWGIIKLLSRFNHDSSLCCVTNIIGNDVWLNNVEDVLAEMDVSLLISDYDKLMLAKDYFNIVVAAVDQSVDYSADIINGLDDFELIASRIIANKALTPEAEKEGYEEYAVSKFNAYNMQRKNPQASCGEVLDSFSRLPIFKSVVYADGGVKMYDGSYLKPLRPVTKPSPKAKKK